jgi:hypothetical protein
MAFPVHRMSIISPDGKQVMAKDLGGIVGTTQVAIPVLSKGQYLVTFYGNGGRVQKSLCRRMIYTINM